MWQLILSISEIHKTPPHSEFRIQSFKQNQLYHFQLKRKTKQELHRYQMCDFFTVVIFI